MIFPSVEIERTGVTIFIVQDSFRRFRETRGTTNLLARCAPGLEPGRWHDPHSGAEGSSAAAFQAIRGLQPERNSLDRLWVRQISFPSALTFSSPRRPKR